MRTTSGACSNHRYRVRIIQYLQFLCLFALLPQALATPYYGANVSYVALPKDPPQLHGYQLMLNYDPDQFKWRRFNVYFDGGFSHFWQNHTTNYSALNIYSVAPVIRYNFKKRGPISPFLELSIGLSYLSRTRLEDRNLGMHFAFQDRMGVGALLGASEQLSLGLHAVHYSNAHLAHHNAGLTIPLLLDVGYRLK
jgi:hypothetical protein